MKRYLVTRPKDTVEVAIMLHKNTGKYSFVNLTKGHICLCKFDSHAKALQDMEDQIRLGKVINYKEIG